MPRMSFRARGYAQQRTDSWTQSVPRPAGGCGWLVCKAGAKANPVSACPWLAESELSPASNFAQGVRAQAVLWERN